jgi:DNA-binding SARP family transcriptional activator/tetratricopeptide (TPR) repeat protein
MGDGLAFEALGPLRVTRGGADVELRGMLQRRLLAALLVRRDRAVPASVLCDAVWPDQVVGEQRLHVLVSRLRGILGDASRILLENDGYRLRVEPAEVDVERFTAAVAAATAEPDPATVATLLSDALRLWRGDPFDGLDVPLLAAETARLVELRLDATEHRFRAELRRGRHESVIGELADQVRKNPLREGLAGLLMIALARCGRRAEALAAYRATRRTLVAELSVEPGPELRAVERQILAGERIDVDAPAARPLVPAQLPPAVPDFVGREPELIELDHARATGRVCVVAGTAGVGKTALALRWAHRVRADFPDGQLYADLRGFGPDEPLSVPDVLAGFLRELGVAGNAIPHELAERVARFRTLVDGRRMLVVLDNARTADQVRPLLPGSSSVFVLVTSRNSLTGLAARDGSRRLALGRLPTGEAVALVRAAVGPRAEEEPDAVAALVEQCARLPLALGIVAELINLRQGMPIAELVTELASEEDRLDALDVDDDVQSSVRAVFSWSYQSLSPEAARLFRLCGLFPGRDIDPYALAALAGADLGATRRSVDQLVRAHLVDQGVDGRIQLHDLLSAYAAELAERTDSATDRSAAVRRLCAYYLNAVYAATEHLDRDDMTMRPVPEPTELSLPTFADSARAKSWLDVERATLLKLAAVAPEHGSPRTAVALSALLYRFFDSGYLDDGWILHTHGRECARLLGDRVAEAHAVELLARTQMRRGNLRAALELGAEALDSYVAVGERRHQAVTLAFLGWTHFSGGAYDEALGIFTRVLDEYPEWVREGSVRVEVMRGIGTVHGRRGRLTEAKRYLLDALAGAREMDSPRWERTARSNLGRVCQRLGQYAEAAEHMEWAVTSLSGKIGDEIQRAYGYELGPVYWALGRRDDAFAAAWRCLAACQEAGMMIPHARALNALGQLHRLDGDLEAAEEHYRDALDRTVDRYSSAEAHDGLGDVFADQGDLAAARESWRTALELYRALGVPEASEVDGKLRAPSELGADA